MLNISGRVLDYIIEPVPVDIPQQSGHTGVPSVIQVACGRAHSVFLTKTGGEENHGATSLHDAVFLFKY